LPDRHRIRRSNIVCAESMPGEEALLEEFIDVHLAATPERRLLGQLVALWRNRCRFRVSVARPPIEAARAAATIRDRSLVISRLLVAGSSSRTQVSSCGK
jgi:hypothetical protein